jgi:hypothetical protein
VGPELDTHGAVSAETASAHVRTLASVRRADTGVYPQRRVSRWLSSRRRGALGAQAARAAASTVAGVALIHATTPTQCPAHGTADVTQSSTAAAELRRPAGCTRKRAAVDAPAHAQQQNRRSSAINDWNSELHASVSERALNGDDRSRQHVATGALHGGEGPWIQVRQHDSQQLLRESHDSVAGARSGSRRHDPRAAGSLRA